MASLELVRSVSRDRGCWARQTGIWHGYAVPVASGTWRPELAVRLIGRSPEKPHNEPTSPICIAYLALQSRASGERFAGRFGRIIDEFFAWFKQAPRRGFTKATVSAWRVSLEVHGLGSSSIIIRMSAIRKLAVEAADNGCTGIGGGNRSPGRAKRHLFSRFCL